MDIVRLFIQPWERYTKWTDPLPAPAVNTVDYEWIVAFVPEIGAFRDALDLVTQGWIGVNMKTERYSDRAGYPAYVVNYDPRHTTVEKVTQEIEMFTETIGGILQPRQS